MEVDKDILEAARKAWNKMEAVFSDKPEFFNTGSKEFETFYNQLVSHLFEKEKEV